MNIFVLYVTDDIEWIVKWFASFASIFSSFYIFKVRNLYK